MSNPIEAIQLTHPIEKFSSSALFNQLLLYIKQQQKVLLKGSSGSHAVMLLKALFNHSPKTILAILPDREEAAYFLNDLESLPGGERQLYFFSHAQKRPYHTADPNLSLLRAETLNALAAASKPAIVVTSAHAIAEKVLTRKTLEQNTFEVQAGAPLDIAFVHDFLESIHFRRVDFVAQPGEYAIRGGIVDVFSFALELPVRIEFFGDQVDSLRSFDVSSQLSISSMQFFRIIPDVQSHEVLQEQQTLLDFLPPDALLWIKDPSLIFERIKELQSLAKDAYARLEQPEANLAPQEAFAEADELYAQILARPYLVYGFGADALKNDASIAFQTSVQPPFSKQFDKIAESLIAFKKKGYDNYIFSDNPRQIDRIESIFQDLGKEAAFAPVHHALHEGFIDHHSQWVAFSDHQLFDRYHRYKIKDGFARKEAITLKELKGLQPGDYVTHIDHGIGKFAGLEKIDVNGKTQEAIRLVYRDNDILYVSITSLHRIAKYSGKDGAEVKMSKLGSGAWAATKAKTKSKVKDIARELIKLYAERKSKPGFAFSKDNYLQHELEASFVYEDTPDQLKATQEVKKDMEKPYPMDRLVCGDVGFGKTEVAIRAAFKAVNDGKQVAVLVPTTILSWQHYKTFSQRLSEFPVKIDYINRFKSAKAIKETLTLLKEGKLDIIIGTHRLLSKDVIFKDLGLMIIDEEQKFGVSSKERLKQIRINVDALTLTATPIPRTLHFSMMGARDLSVINTPPPNRFPVTTELHHFNPDIIRDAIQYEMQRGGQVFFVHNRVQNIQEIKDLILKLCPGVKIAVGHGQLEAEQLEEVMLGFINGDFDVLVATTIIESGLDIPNANTIIINNAHLFGLSDLHQMRGRVGRSNKKAFCYLLTSPVSLLTSEARKRLKAIEDFAELGSGFNIAMRDLDIRGAGNLLGAEQSGFIADMGFEMYQKILDEAVQELKESEFHDLFSEELAEKKHKFDVDCVIDTDLELHIPDTYVSSGTERLFLYRELDQLAGEVELLSYEKKLKDRFGPLPSQVNELLNTIRMRWLASQLGFEKIVFKQQTLIAYFIANPRHAFYESGRFQQLIAAIHQAKVPARLREKNQKLSLAASPLRSIADIIQLFQKLISQLAS